MRKLVQTKENLEKVEATSELLTIKKVQIPKTNNFATYATICLDDEKGIPFWVELNITKIQDELENQKKPILKVRDKVRIIGNIKIIPSKIKDENGNSLYKYNRFTWIDEFEILERSKISKTIIKDLSIINNI